MKPIDIMLNGLPGNVATTIAAHALNDPHLRVLPYSLTGPEIETEAVRISQHRIELIRPEQREERLAQIMERHDGLIGVDFTHPSAVNANAAFYCRLELPFVMGTTGGDRDQLIRTVEQSAVCAVIAPNMAKQIVGFQAMMEYAATAFPGLFSGYTLQVRESHQAGKADTSGTAKAVVASFQRMGVDFSPASIEMERDPAVQHDAWGIPEEYLSGHGWHTYRLTSADRTVTFEFQHNVNGRDIYADGTLDAVRFLYRKMAEGRRGTVFSMIDVLRG